MDKTANLHPITTPTTAARQGKPEDIPALVDGQRFTVTGDRRRQYSTYRVFTLRGYYHQEDNAHLRERMTMDEFLTDQQARFPQEREVTATMEASMLVSRELQAQGYGYKKPDTALAIGQLVQIEGRRFHLVPTGNGNVSFEEVK